MLGVLVYPFASLGCHQQFYCIRVSPLSRHVQGGLPKHVSVVSTSTMTQEQFDHVHIAVRCSNLQWGVVVSPSFLVDICAVLNEKFGDRDVVSERGKLKGRKFALPYGVWVCAVGEQKFRDALIAVLCRDVQRCDAKHWALPAGFRRVACEQAPDRGLVVVPDGSVYSRLAVHKID